MSGICEGFQSLFSSMDSEVVCNESRFGLRQRARLRRGSHQVQSRFQSRFPESVPQGSMILCEVGSEGEERPFHFSDACRFLFRKLRRKVCDFRVCIDEISVKQVCGDIRSSAEV